MRADSEETLIAEWLAVGRDNLWISRAWDPPFNERSFCRCKDALDLRAKFVHGNWTLGQAFYLPHIDLCFIQQVDGGDEWLTIRHGISFESISWQVVIRQGEFSGMLADLMCATEQQCRDLTYRTRDRSTA